MEYQLSENSAIEEISNETSSEEEDPVLVKDLAFIEAKYKKKNFKYCRLTPRDIDLKSEIVEIDMLPKLTEMLKSLADPTQENQTQIEEWVISRELPFDEDEWFDQQLLLETMIEEKAK